jgi:hypothetical protein
MRLKTLPIFLVRDLSIYEMQCWKIKDLADQKNRQGLIYQRYKFIKLHNLRNLWSYVTLKRGMRLKTLPIFLVRDLSIYEMQCWKIKDLADQKNRQGLIYQRYKFIKLHNLRNLCNAEESYTIENSSCTAILTILANSPKNDFALKMMPTMEGIHLLNL